MQCTALRNDILAARDRRQAELTATLERQSVTTIQLALNLPGAVKNPPGAESLFSWGERRLYTEFPDLGRLFTDIDILGPWGLYTCPVSVVEAKFRCCAIENSRNFARLLDIDVYLSDGTPCDRSWFGQQQRRCLLCGAPARECIRLQRHPLALLERQCENLLKPFAA